MCKAEDNCKACFKKSCASHEEMSARWSPGNILHACEVALNSHYKYEMICPDIKCKHYYKVAPIDMNHKNSLCSFCANKQFCPPSENCKICLVKSCAAHPLMSKFWAKTNKITASQTFLNCHDNRDFICDECPSGENLFSMRPNDISMRNSWCPNCVNKTEAKLKKMFLKHGFNLGKVTFRWCMNSKTGRYYPFDIAIEKYKLFIECDGDFHFIQKYKNQDVKKRQEVDAYKMLCAQKHGYTMIRIYQPDVWEDKNDWKNKLLACIKKYSTPQVIYISSKPDIYDSLKKEFKRISNLQLIDESDSECEDEVIPVKKSTKSSTKKNTIDYGERDI